MKPWHELISSDDDAIALIEQWHADSPLDVTLCACTNEAGQRTLEALQITTRSPLGAVAFHTGGILIDGGFLRVLGAGSELLPRTLDHWNGIANNTIGMRCNEGLLVADDAIGGFFAWFNTPRTIHYLSPDTAEWEDLELGYGDWLQWTLSDALPAFYKELRWDGWREEVARVSGDRGIHIFPPLWVADVDMAARSRRAVPIEELWALATGMNATLRSDE